MILFLYTVICSKLILILMNDIKTMDQSLLRGFIEWFFTLLAWYKVPSFIKYLLFGSITTILKFLKHRGRTLHILKSETMCISDSTVKPKSKRKHAALRQNVLIFYTFFLHISRG